MVAESEALKVVPTTGLLNSQRREPRPRDQRVRRRV